jgi:hypothetical protein
MTSEVLPDVNDLQEDDFTGVIFNDDDGTVPFQDPERPDPEDVLDRFNGMRMIEGIMRPNFASQKFSSHLTESRIVIIHD